VQLKLVGIFSHLSNTSQADDLAQQAEFERAIAEAGKRSLSFEVRHLAASAATLSFPEMRYDMVRCGITIYGLTPDDRPISPHGLKPVMRASARIANLKQVPVGQSVSYGYLYTTEQPTTLALVPFGYSEGMPRIARGAKVAIRGQLFQVVGRIAMDQFVVDVGDAALELGDEVVIFGDASRGEPRVEDLAYAAQTINYEVVTRIGGRAKRVFVSA
jgi:alanine racemase